MSLNLLLFQKIDKLYEKQINLNKTQFNNYITSHNQHIYNVNFSINNPIANTISFNNGVTLIVAFG